MRRSRAGGGGRQDVFSPPPAVQSNLFVPSFLCSSHPPAQVASMSEAVPPRESHTPEVLSLRTLAGNVVQKKKCAEEGNVISCGLLLPELLVRVRQGMAVEATRSHCGDHGTSTTPYLAYANRAANSPCPPATHRCCPHHPQLAWYTKLRPRAVRPNPTDSVFRNPVAYTGPRERTSRRDGGASQGTLHRRAVDTWDRPQSYRTRSWAVKYLDQCLCSTAGDARAQQVASAMQYLAQPWFLYQRAVLGASPMDSYRDVLDDLVQQSQH